MESYSNLKLAAEIHFYAKISVKIKQENLKKSNKVLYVMKTARNIAKSLKYEFLT